MNRSTFHKFFSFLVCAFLAMILYQLLFVGGGGGRGSGFKFSNLYVDYFIDTGGVFGGDHLEYLVIMSEFPTNQTSFFSGRKGSFSFAYVDGGKVNFNTKPGQTVWIGKDRKLLISNDNFSMTDVLLMEKYREDISRNVESPEALRDVVDKLRVLDKKR